jgi:chromosome segregation ATPase
MKTNVIGFIIAGAISLTACTKKVDEKTIGEINQFGTDWSALGEKATAWSNDLQQTTTKAKEFATQQEALATSMATTKDQAMKTKVNEMASKAKEDASHFEGMETEWNTFKSTWDENTKQFTEWKDKVLKGQVTSEDAQKGIADFKTKMSDAQAKIDSWGTQYAEAKSSCEQNMAMAETIKPAETTKK